ncbi:MAG: hypothetical protein MJA82_00330 [Clostridia bacterium]|nr:hypothetical protein [Clostridia bacterium]
MPKIKILLEEYEESVDSMRKNEVAFTALVGSAIAAVYAFNAYMEAIKRIRCNLGGAHC